MCGRYYFSIDLGNLSFVENIDEFSFEENFNIAPQTSVPVVIDNKLKECTWGYYPQWLKDQSNSRPLFNTRFESLLELSLIHISEPTRQEASRMPSSA